MRISRKTSQIPFLRGGVVLASVLPFWPSHVDAQQALDYPATSANHILSGTESVARFGTAISPAGDLNLDGYADFLVSSPNAEGGGRVYAFSGKTAQILGSFTGDALSVRYGTSVSEGGRIDSDLFPDFIVGDSRARLFGTNSGRVYVISGATGQPIRMLTCDSVPSAKCGSAVAGNCDVNGDGAKDILVGASDGGPLRQGRVFAYSGLDGSLLFTVDGEAQGDQFGDKVVCGGDINGDAYDDFIVSAWANDSAGLQSGAVYVYSSKTRELMFRFQGQTDDAFGTSIAGGGDINYDGYLDILVGAPQGMGAGYARAYSGRDGQLLLTVHGGAESANFGSAVGFVSDQTGDHVDELLVGDPTYQQARGRVYLFSGYNGELLSTFTGEVGEPVDDNNFGAVIAAVGDTNKDGGKDFVMAAPTNDQGGLAAGRAYLFYGQVVAVPSPTVSPSATPSPTALPGGDYGGVIDPGLCPSPSASVCPEPIVCATPAPTPEQVVCPTPAPTPEPVVCPTPEPTPTPVVCPTPSPAPVCTPDLNGDGVLNINDFLYYFDTYLSNMSQSEFNNFVNHVLRPRLNKRN